MRSPLVRLWLALALMVSVTLAAVGVLSARAVSGHDHDAAISALRDRVNAAAIAVAHADVPADARDVWVYRPQCAAPEPGPSGAAPSPLPSTAPAPAAAVCPDTHVVNALGDTDVEAPVTTLGDRALGSGETVDQITVGGRTYLVMARELAGAPTPTAVVAADRLDVRLADLLRRQFGLGALLAFWDLLLLSAMAGLLFIQARRRRRERASQLDFLADAAHELRTPLAVVQASASQALARDRDGAQYIAALHEIHAAAEQAGAGVRELLDLARLDAERPQLRRAPLRVDLLAEEVAESVRVDGVAIVAAPTDAVVASADLGLLRQALVNAVVNASRYATQVSLRTEIRSGTVLIHVADNGPGFSETMLIHAFERFRQGDRRGTAGLGLAIVRRIAELHGGTATARNSDGGGAEVTIQIPLRA